MKKSVHFVGFHYIRITVHTTLFPLPTSTQLVNNFHTFYGTQMFINVLTRTQHRFVSRAK